MTGNLFTNVFQFSIFHSGFENEILDEKSEFHSPEDLDEVIAFDRNRGKEKNNSETIIGT